jgi:hypothetical protein
VSPDWAARLPPPEALRHGVPAGTVPRPRPVPARALPEMLVLNAEVGQRGVDAQTLDYERFGQHIWRDDSGKFIGLEFVIEKYCFFSSTASDQFLRIRLRSDPNLFWLFRIWSYFISARDNFADLDPECTILCVQSNTGNIM